MTQFFRPEALALIRRWRETTLAGLMAAFGLLVALSGGWVLGPFGLGLTALGLGWGLVALRRMRFARRIAAPGVVEVDEGQVGYFGPDFGGFVALRELAQIQLIELRGAAHWRLKQTDGQTLLIPVAAQGSALLFDAFATLPGIDMAGVTAALGASDDDTSALATVWKRPAHAALT